MRFGTIPVASRVGGLADTISDYAFELDRYSAANGFLFEGETAVDVANAVTRAVDAFKNPSLWRTLQHNAMTRDSGWNIPVRRYLDVYGELTDARPATRVETLVEASADAPLNLGEHAGLEQAVLPTNTVRTGRRPQAQPSRDDKPQAAAL
jgi:hypothetical protein